MAYSKTTWNAGVAPGISAANLNNLETQYDEVLAILTTRGDIAYRGAATWERLPKGTAGQVLKQGANDPYWATEVPSGVICMWHGTLASIPAGWALCDGSSGTPDLREKFVVGTRHGVNPGTTGGAKNKTTAGHQHALPMGSNSFPPAAPAYFNFAWSNVWGTGANITVYKTITPLPGMTESAPAMLSNTGTDTIADIRPPFYEIAFIMKL
jgi:hypothetical protein